MKRKISNGERFGMWLVTGVAVTPSRFNYYECECLCGNTGVIREDSLLNGASKSCSCYNKERASEVHWKHGKFSDKFGKRESYGV